jgi:muramidase (phage lysozyme)
MLTPGEFVMSKGAVNAFGVDTLASMNSAGGGTNKPKYFDGSMFAQGGGYVEKKEELSPKLNKEMKERSGDEKVSGGGGKKWWDFLGWAGTDKKKEETSSENKGGISGNAKALLNTIRWAEGTLKPGGYNTWFGGRTDMDLTKMTIDEVVAEQKRRLSNGEATYGQYTSAAVGAYQMMKPEAFASAAGLSGKSLFTPENQDKMAIAGYMMGQAGMTQAEIDAPISREQIAKIAPVWASLPMMNGQSRYGQPVKRYEDLVSVYQKNLGGLDPSSFSSTTTIAGANNVKRGGGSSSSGGGATQSTGVSTKPAKPIDFGALRKELGITAAVSKPSRPSSTAAYQQTQMQSAQQAQAPQGEAKSSETVPSFDAAAMSSSKKIKVLGITV